MRCNTLHFIQLEAANVTVWFDEINLIPALNLADYTVDCNQMYSEYYMPLLNEQLNSHSLHVC